MKKPTIEEIKQDFAKWHGTEWKSTRNERVVRLMGIDPRDNLVLSDFGSHNIDWCELYEPPVEGWVNVYEDGSSIVFLNASKEDALKNVSTVRKIKTIKVREVRDE